MAETVTTRLVKQGGRYLPPSAWRTAIAEHGVELLEGAQFIPEAVALELFEGNKTVPYKAAVNIAKASHGKVLDHLSVDRRSNVQTAVLKHWVAPTETVEAYLDSGPSEDVVEVLVGMRMPLETRMRLWSHMDFKDALIDALRYSDVLTDDAVRQLASRDGYQSYRNTLQPVSAVLQMHPHLVEEIAVTSKPYAACAAANIRAGAEAAESLLARTTDLNNGEEILTHARMCVALADNPATPVGLRHKAISIAKRLDVTLHRTAAVFPDTVPYVASVDEWTDEAARIALVRGLRDFWYDGITARLWTLVELLGAPRVSEDLRLSAVLRFFEATRHETGWGTVYEDHISTVTELGVEPHIVRFWREKAQKAEASRLYRPGTALVTEPVPPVQVDLPLHCCEHDGDAHVYGLYTEVEYRHAAKYLGENLAGDDEWMLAWEMMKGFSGTLSDLVALVKLT